jgi:hypothetical protein
MKYLALIYADEAAWDGLGNDERQAMYAQYRAFGEEARGAGKLVDGAELAPTTSATTVRIRGDETLLSDGPFAETKEALGGYYILDCDSFDEAVAFAAKIPAASRGAVEVRPAHVEEDEG